MVNDEAHTFAVWFLENQVLIKIFNLFVFIMEIYFGRL